MLRALMFILPLALTIYAFIDCLNTPEEEVKHLPKVAWVFIILLFWIVGAVVWLVAGRRRGDAPRIAGGGRAGRGGGWVAPDDNPEFLKSLRKDRADGPDQRDAGAPGPDGDKDEDEDDDRRPADEPGDGGPAKP
ncbi:hypothetical protein C6N75_02200 [Streptomyces solincola]|uniref:Cardiolipin synthase N-terminal domain-containing protein n=1 Tax=Streptomyces solincola TaxID=2100817 RepID=A0A2S9Q2B4_9ACTN|nr:PLD nuclease N-terminal domain-containing protein [Streptomyces solincola]PRH80796.1 hypothetical protein C6N75_02200 [Streptomyces solincola]